MNNLFRQILIISIIVVLGIQPLSTSDVSQQLHPLSTDISNQLDSTHLHDDNHMSTPPDTIISKENDSDIFDFFKKNSSSRLDKIGKNLPYRFIQGELIIKFQNSIQINLCQSPLGIAHTGITGIDELNTRYHVQLIEPLSQIRQNTHSNAVFNNIYKIEYSLPVHPFSIAREYSKHHAVIYAEPNVEYEFCTIPDDPDFGKQWALHNSGQTGGYTDADIDAPEAWNVETGSSEVVIAIVDSGIDYTHNDLQTNIWRNENEIAGNGLDDDGNGYIDDIRGWDCYETDNDPMDDFGHGTHCAGIAGATTDNKRGIAGVCWNCALMPVRVGCRTAIPLDAAAQGIVYATENDADIISMSWGGRFASKCIEDAITYAADNGVVLVAAAGNTKSDEYYYPAAYTQVIAVAATNHYDHKAGFSTYGDWIDVAAPGDDIYSTLLNNTYGEESGTSMASPLIAGVAGLILSKNKSLTDEMVAMLIQFCVDDIHSSYELGKGRINASDAVTRAPFIVRLNDIQNWTNISGELSIFGTAWGKRFLYYTIAYGHGEKPDTWTEIQNRSTTVQDDVLATLNASELDEGRHTLKLTVACSDGNYNDTTHIVVNNYCSQLFVDDDGGPEVYTSINDAVSDAGDGDIVFVYNGTYYEHILVESQIKLIGEQVNTTVINARNIEREPVIQIESSYMKVANFTLLYNEDEGIHVSSTSKFCTISSNRLQGGYFDEDICVEGKFNNISNNCINSHLIGIVISFGHDNYIYDNTIILDRYWNYYGILLQYSFDNIIRKNTIVDSEISISLMNSFENILKQNIMSRGGIEVSGESLQEYINFVDETNLVQHKPIYYYIHQKQCTVPCDAGQIIIVNCSNCTISNQHLNGTCIGVAIYFSNTISVINNMIQNCFYGIFTSKTIYNINISSNKCYSCYLGVLTFSNHVNITNNVIISKNKDYEHHGGVGVAGDGNYIEKNIIQSGYGIILAEASENKIRNNICDTCIRGCLLYQSGGNVFRNNHLLNCSLEVRCRYYGDKEQALSFLSNDIDKSNTVNGKPIYYWIDQENKMIPQNAGEVILINCSNCTIINITTGAGTVGIAFFYSDANLIRKCCLCNIIFINSSENTIINNFINKGKDLEAIYLRYFSQNNTILANTISHNEHYGIRIRDDANFNTIADNLITDHTGIGISLLSSSFITIQNNTIKNNVYRGIEANSVDNVVIKNNFLSDSVSGIYIGSMYNCSIGNNTIVHNRDYGLFLCGLDETYLLENLITQSDYGIYLWGSSHSKIHNNTIQNTTIGIYLEGNQNIFTHNLIAQNTYCGIKMYCSSKDNIFLENTITDTHEFGILFHQFGGVIDNHLYHNTFTNNSIHAYDEGENNWDNGYPSGGNYWDDYNGTDADGDGIGDTSYQIPGDRNKDRYPLMQPYKPDNVSPTIDIIHPAKYFLYIKNRKVVPFFTTLIFGDVAIVVNASDALSGIQRLELFINNDFKGNDTTPPYIFIWKRERIHLFDHYYTIKVIAFDYAGNHAYQERFVWKFL